MNDISKLFAKTAVKYSSQTLGDLEFKGISVGDADRIRTLLRNPYSNKEFSIKVLHNQLTTDIGYPIFAELSNRELKEIINKFARADNFIQGQYSTVESPDEFYKFRFSSQKSIEELDKKLKEMGDAIRKKFKVLRSNLKLNFTPQLIPKITIPKILFPKVTTPKLVIPDINKSLKKFSETFTQTLKIQVKVWAEFQNAHKNLSKKSLRNLNKYNWIISDSMPVTFLAETARIKNAKDMKSLFVDYHTYNDCEVLDEYLKSWKQKPLFKKRLKILSDTIDVFKLNMKSGKVNINNVVIPALINQIEGLRQDYLTNKGIVGLGNNQWQDPVTRTTMTWSDFYIAEVANESEFTKSALSLFINVLFQRDGQNAPITNFSRHKIAHGVNTRYGSLETTVRCLLVINMFSELP